MVSPKLRSRSYRKTQKRTPGGRLKFRYRRNKVSKARCSICKKPLSGVPRKRPSSMSKLSKSKKKPERLYGGNLCVSCLRNLIKERARGE